MWSDMSCSRNEGLHNLHVSSEGKGMYACKCDDTDDNGLVGVWMSQDVGVSVFGKCWTWAGLGQGLQHPLGVKVLS